MQLWWSDKAYIITMNFDSEYTMIYVLIQKRSCSAEYGPDAWQLGEK